MDSKKGKKRRLTHKKTSTASSDEPVAGPSSSNKKPRLQSETAPVKNEPGTPIMYQLNEKVICQFGDQRYLAKIVDTMSKTKFTAIQENQKNGQPSKDVDADETRQNESKAEELIYHIHYIGWSGKWDEWVDNQRLFPAPSDVKDQITPKRAPKTKVVVDSDSKKEKQTAKPDTVEVSMPSKTRNSKNASLKTKVSRKSLINKSIGKQSKNAEDIMPLEVESLKKLQPNEKEREEVQVPMPSKAADLKMTAPNHHLSNKEHEKSQVVPLKTENPKNTEPNQKINEIEREEVQVPIPSKAANLKMTAPNQHLSDKEHEKSQGLPTEKPKKTAPDQKINEKEREEVQVPMPSDAANLKTTTPNQHLSVKEHDKSQVLPLKTENPKKNAVDQKINDEHEEAQIPMPSKATNLENPKKTAPNQKINAKGPEEVKIPMPSNAANLKMTTPNPHLRDKDHDKSQVLPLKTENPKKTAPNQIIDEKGHEKAEVSTSSEAQDLDRQVPAALKAENLKKPKVFKIPKHEPIDKKVTKSEVPTQMKPEYVKKANIFKIPKQEPADKGSPLQKPNVFKIPKQEMIDKKVRKSDVSTPPQPDHVKKRNIFKMPKQEAMEKKNKRTHVHVQIEAEHLKKPSPKQETAGEKTIRNRVPALFEPDNLKKSALKQKTVDKKTDRNNVSTSMTHPPKFFEPEHVKPPVPKQELKEKKTKRVPELFEPEHVIIRVPKQETAAKKTKIPVLFEPEYLKKSVIKKDPKTQVSSSSELKPAKKSVLNREMVPKKSSSTSLETRQLKKPEAKQETIEKNPKRTHVSPPLDAKHPKKSSLKKEPKTHISTPSESKHSKESVPNHEVEDMKPKKANVPTPLESGHLEKPVLSQETVEQKSETLGQVLVVMRVETENLKSLEQDQEINQHESEKATVSVPLEADDHPKKATVSVPLEVDNHAKKATVSVPLEADNHAKKATVSVPLETDNHAKKATVSVPLETDNHAKKATVSVPLEADNHAKKATVSVPLETDNHAKKATVSVPLEADNHAKKATVSVPLEAENHSKTPAAKQVEDNTNKEQELRVLEQSKSLQTSQELNDKGSHSHVESQTYPHKSLVHVITSDYDKIKYHNMILEWPAKVSVEDVLNDYINTIGSLHADNFCEKTKAGLYANGLRTVLNCSFKSLLYEPERPVVEEIVAKYMKSEGGRTPYTYAKLASPMYLLRFMSRIDEYHLQSLSLEDVEGRQILGKEKAKLIRFLFNNMEKYFPLAAYKPITQENTREEAVICCA